MVYFFGGLESVSRLKPQAETVLQAFQDISNCLMIRVPSQFQSKFRHVQRRHHRHWMEGGTCYERQDCNKKQMLDIVQQPIFFLCKIKPMVLHKTVLLSCAYTCDMVNNIIKNQDKSNYLHEEFL